MKTTAYVPPESTQKVRADLDFNAPASKEKGNGLSAALQIITRRASEVKPEPISWLWKYWIARGKLHIIG